MSTSRPKSNELDTILIHRLHDLRPGISIHITENGETRVITEALSWRTLSRLVASGAKILSEDLG